MKILPKIHVIFIVLTHNHGNEACDIQNAQKACDLEQIQQGLKWAWGSTSGSPNQLVIQTPRRRVLAGGNAPKSFAVIGVGLILHHLLQTKNFSGLVAAGKSCRKICGWTGRDKL